MPTHTITPKKTPTEKKDQKTVVTPGGPRLKENTWKGDGNDNLNVAQLCG